MNEIRTGSSLVGAGSGNLIDLGGVNNFIGAGALNVIGTNGDAAVIGGGIRNLANGSGASVLGGFNNRARGLFSTIPGGTGNEADGDYSFAAGRRAKARHDGTFVWADTTDQIFETTGTNQVLVRASGGMAINTNDPGGADLNVAGALRADVLQPQPGEPFRVETPDGSPLLRISSNGNVLVGSSILGSSVSGSTITGGGQVGEPHEVRADNSLIGAGGANRIAEGSPNSAIVAGLGNVIGTNATSSFTGAGNGNQVNAFASSIVGGSQNRIEVEGFGHAFIGGGQLNVVTSNAGEAVIGAGIFNKASGPGSFIGAGTFNVASGFSSMVPGGDRNEAGGASSFAAGRQAKALHDGTFVWADAQASDFVSTGTNQILIRASGGMAINTNDPNGAALRVAGTVQASAFAGDGSLLSNLPSLWLSGASGTAYRTAGPVGIGLSSPEAMLHVFDGDDPTIKIQSDGLSEDSGRLSLRQSNDTGYDMVYDGAEDVLRFESYIGGDLTANTLVMQLDGDIGIGTSNPEADLHIVKLSDPVIKLQSGANNVPSGRLSMRQGNDTGYDIFYDGGEDDLVFESFRSGSSQGAKLRMDLDGRMGLGHYYSDVMLNVRYASGQDYGILVEDTSGETSFAIRGGNTGIGRVPFSDVQLLVRSDAGNTYGLLIENSSGGDILYAGGADNALYVYTDRGSARRQDDSPFWSTFSDRRLKEDIEPVADPLATLHQLRPVTYRYNEAYREKGGTADNMIRYGLVAQEFREVFPDYVDEDSDGYLSIRSDPLIFVSVAAINALHDQVQDVQAENKALRKELDTLKTLVNGLLESTAP